MEQTFIIIKPDALQRSLLGEIIHRFERKGLKIIALKMAQVTDEKITEHYGHHSDKPFFPGLKSFMQSAPVVMMIVEGVEAIETVRLITGATKGRAADAGTLRGDFAMSMQSNIVHASDSVDSAAAEIKRFFAPEEIFSYTHHNEEWVYAPDERA